MERSGKIEKKCDAADWYVHPEQGNDENPGTKEAQFASIQRAVDQANPGDIIHLLPENGLYRQSVQFNNKQSITLEGNGVTLSGADVLPVDGWETVSAGLFRRQLPRTAYDRQLLIRSKKMERMGRTQSSNAPAFPQPEQLQSGEFSFVEIDDQAGWLYVSGSTSMLEWSTRVNGIATAGENHDLKIRHIRCCYFLNDGFNLHGTASGLIFENVAGYDCFDEGFSAHDDCECLIQHAKFWGNENGCADVNRAVTRYHQTQFLNNFHNDCLLIGQAHELVDCQIINNGHAAALVAGPRDQIQVPFSLLLKNVSVKGVSVVTPARIRVNGGRLTLQNFQQEFAEFNTIGADVESVSKTTAINNQ